MIEIRDLQQFLTHTLKYCDYLCTNNGCKNVISFIADGIAYFMGRMHASDARVLQKQTPLFLHEDNNSVEIQGSLMFLIRCTEHMCMINTKVILSALKG
jgi:alkaline phosphatase